MSVNEFKLLKEKKFDMDELIICECICIFKNNCGFVFVFIVYGCFICKVKNDFLI